MAIDYCLLFLLPYTQPVIEVVSHYKTPADFPKGVMSPMRPVKFSKGKLHKFMF